MKNQELSEFPSTVGIRWSRHLSCLECWMSEKTKQPSILHCLGALLCRKKYIASILEQYADFTLWSTFHKQKLAIYNYYILYYIKCITIYCDVWERLPGDIAAVRPSNLVRNQWHKHVSTLTSWQSYPPQRIQGWLQTGVSAVTSQQSRFREGDIR
jgi:hypothetical protein